jgi:hypothetical protein
VTLSYEVLWLQVHNILAAVKKKIEVVSFPKNMWWEEDQKNLDHKQLET